MVLAGIAVAQEPPAMEPLDLVEGPLTADLGEIAEVEVPEGYRFAPQEEAKTLLEWMGNPLSGGELGLVLPEEGEWFLVFEFAPVGFVRDDEKDSLDADELLETLREGNDRANRERKRRGWQQLELLGWEQPPRYNPETHHLEWATRSSNGEALVVNHNTRVLGRRGVMEVTLVCDEATFPTALPPARDLLGGFGYQKGHTYGEYRKGDMVAAYGLTGLVAGGLAVAAAKSGILGKAWKFLVVAAAAAVASVKKLFRRRGAVQTIA
jgi:uncharacterized membrane-anchored protein